MPTPKQVKEHYKKIRYHLYRLQVALNNAHEAEVIVYDDGRFVDEGPCYSLDQCKKRIELTTMVARAMAFRTECLRELKGIW